MTTPEPQVTTLPSGLRIASQAMPGVRTVAGGVWVRAGSRDELADEHGLAHFLEHMAFKGTQRRSALRIAEDMETIGGEFNASTHVETTAYDVRLMGEDLPAALDIIADILAHSVFDDKEIGREKGVILQELGGAEDSPEDWLADLFAARAFPDQSLGRPILGSRQSVRNFDADALRRYMARRYRAPAMIVAAAGDIDHARLVDEAVRLFESFPEAAPVAPAPATYVGGEIRQSRRLEQTHLMLGFRGRSFHDPGRFAAHLFAHIVGGGMSSRLFQEVRERRGLAYHIDAQHWSYTDSGLFSVAAGMSDADAADVVNISLDEIARATRDIAQTELDRSRAQMKVSLMSAYESPTARADQLAMQLLTYDRLISGDEILDTLNALTIEAVRAAGRDLLQTPPTLAIVGPVKRAPRLAAVAARVGAPMPKAI